MTATDPRLVALYDLDNPGGADHDYYRDLADQVDATRVVDLGCGTGMLTVSLARPGRTIFGIDPDAGMLSYARHRPGADAVTWILGDSAAIDQTEVDLVIMTGNVVQHILGDAWPRTLADIRRSLRDGGTVAFEARNPAARAWLSWDRTHTYGTRATSDGPLTEWLEVVAIDQTGTVTFEAHNVFERTGEHLTVRESLAFRSADQISHDLSRAGLSTTHRWGGWSRQPLDVTSPIMVFEAQPS